MEIINSVAQADHGLLFAVACAVCPVYIFHAENCDVSADNMALTMLSNCR